MAIIISKNGKNAVRVDKSTFDKEDYLQQYIHENPESIPLYDIKEDIHLLILAREFPTNSGPIDAIGIDKDGEIYLVETKLYKNPDKRLVVAQALDYGASLWKNSYRFDEFINQINSFLNKHLHVDIHTRIKEFFKVDDEDTAGIIKNISSNLSDGRFKFIVLMDKLHQQLKDLIIFLNENSEFDIYAVELEYYKYNDYEIMIPKIYGAEVKKDLKTRSTGTLWNWESFKQLLKDIGEEEVTAAQQIIEWAGKNDIEIAWMTNQRGSFTLCFNTEGKKGFYPFAVTGDAMIGWNAPHQGNYSPHPFDKPEKRAEILRRLSSVKGAIVDADNVDGKSSALKLPLRAIVNEDARREFFSVCSWIKKTLEEES